MKTILSLILFASLALAAEIQVIVRDDAGKTISNVTLTVPAAFVNALNQWRLADQQRVETGKDPEGKPIYRNMTVPELWRAVIRGFILQHAPQFHSQIQVERAKIAAAEVAIQQLEAAAVEPKP